MVNVVGHKMSVDYCICVCELDEHQGDWIGEAKSDECKGSALGEMTNMDAIVAKRM